MAKRIPLTRGAFAIVDDDMFEILSRHKWLAIPGGGSKKQLYAVRRPTENGKRRWVWMHKEVLATSNMVDHRDCDGLNNRRDNLRECSNAQNCRNRRRPSNNKSGFKGVYFEKLVGKWRAQLVISGRSVKLGFFQTAELAAKAYDAGAKVYFGEFANPNTVAD